MRVEKKRCTLSKRIDTPRTDGEGDDVEPMDFPDMPPEEALTNDGYKRVREAVQTHPPRSQSRYRNAPTFQGMEVNDIAETFLKVRLGPVETTLHADAINCTANYALIWCWRSPKKPDK